MAKKLFVSFVVGEVLKLCNIVMKSKKKMLAREGYCC
jgi:hypothetical protein